MLSRAVCTEASLLLLDNILLNARNICRCTGLMPPVDDGMPAGKVRNDNSTAHGCQIYKILQCREGTRARIEARWVG